MKILFLTMDGFDTPSPGNQMAMTMIRDFLREGHSVHLIQSRRKRIFPDLPPMLKGHPRLTAETVDRKVIDKTNFPLRFLDEVKWAFQSFFHWKNVKDADVVYVQSCPTAVWQLVLLRLFCKAPVLFSVYEVWPGHAMDLGVIKSRFLYSIFRFIQKIAYKFNSKIAVMSEDMKNRLLQEGVSESKMTIVPPWYDDEAVMPVPESENKFLKKFGIHKDHFTVQFAGTIGYVFDYKLILNAAELLQKDQNIKFQIIGDGAFKEAFVKEASQRGLTNIDFYPLQPIDIVPDVYSACDIAVIPLRKGVIGCGMPSKSPLLMACGKPIINSVETDSEYFKVFQEKNMGISVPRGDASKLAQAIKYLSENPEIRNKMSRNAQNFSRQNFSSSLCTVKFLKAFEEITGK